MRKGIILIIVIVIFGGCSSLSPGRNMIKKNKIATEMSINVLPPSLGVGAKYGLSDKLNINMNIVSPILSCNEAIVLESSLILNMIEEKGAMPMLNSYFKVMTAYEFKKSRFGVPYAIMGIVPKYENDKWGRYAVFEAFFELDNNKDEFDFGSNIKAGIEYKYNEKLSLNLEIGIINAGYQGCEIPMLCIGITKK